MSNTEKFEEILNRYYELAVCSECERSFQSYWDNAFGISSFAVEIGFVSFAEWREIDLKYHNKFLKACEKDFRLEEKKRIENRKKPLTQKEIEYKNKLIEEIFDSIF